MGGGGRGGGGGWPMSRFPARVGESLFCVFGYWQVFEVYAEFDSCFEFVDVLAARAAGS